MVPFPLRTYEFCAVPCLCTFGTGFLGADFPRNCIDTLLVFLRILDVWMLSLVGVESGLRLASGFRIIRMGPAVRHWQATKERGFESIKTRVSSNLWVLVVQCFFF